MAQSNGSTRSTPITATEINELFERLGVDLDEAAEILEASRPNRKQTRETPEVESTALVELEPKGSKRVVIRRDMGGLTAALEGLRLEVRENIRSLRTEIRRLDYDTDAGRRWYELQSLKVPPGGWTPLTDPMSAMVRARIEERFTWAHGKKAKWGATAFNESLLAMLATRRADPVIEWLENLPEWDGVERLDRILVDALDVEDTPLNLEVGARFLIGAVGRTYDPGCVHDWTAVIVGMQGCGKSTLLAELVPPEFREGWYSDSIDFGQSRREQVEAASGAVVVEFSELKGVHRTRLESLKAFISRLYDTIRLSYRKNPDTISRRWVGAGTANDDGTGVLPYDPTGQRCFVIVETPLPLGNERKTRRVRRYMARSREQLWAEAHARYMSVPENERNDLHVIPAGVMEAQHEISGEYQQQDDSLVDTAETLTAQHAGESTGITIAALMVEADLALTETEAMGKINAQLELAKLLKERNWRKARNMVDGIRATRWYPPVAVTPALHEIGKILPAEQVRKLAWDMSMTQAKEALRIVEDRIATLEAAGRTDQAAASEVMDGRAEAVNDYYCISLVLLGRYV